MFDVITLAKTLPSRVKAMMSVAAEPMVSSAAITVTAHRPDRSLPPVTWAQERGPNGPTTGRRGSGRRAGR